MFMFSVHQACDLDYQITPTWIYCSENDRWSNCDFYGHSNTADPSSLKYPKDQQYG